MNKKQIKNGLRFACFSVLCVLLLSLSAFAAIPKVEEVRTNGNGVGMFDEIGNATRNGANEAKGTTGDTARGSADAERNTSHGAGNAMGDAARGAGNAIGDAARDAGDAVGDAADGAGNAISDALDGAMDKDNGVISEGHADDGHVDDNKGESNKNSDAVTNSKDDATMDNTMGDSAEKDGGFHWIWIVVLVLAAAVVLWLLLMPRKRGV